MQLNPKPIFKMPKYTGVTLSLLSLFVLASMFVVWERMLPSSSTSSEENDLHLLAEKSFRSWLEPTRNAYQREFNQTVSVAYFSHNQIVERLNQISDSNVDLFIVTETKDFSDSDAPNFIDARIPVAFHPKGSKLDERFAESPVSAFLAKSSTRITNGLLFARYLAAPSLGQFYLAEKNWIGVNGDRWALIPEISILCDSSLTLDLTRVINTFSQREKIIPNIDSKDFHGIQSSLDIISQSEAKHFLPDIVLSTQALKYPLNYYDEILSNDNGLGIISYHLIRGSHAQMCKRLISTLEEHR
jgi:hypothetical protein